MKKFLSEYGFAILAAIVVILLIAICSPVSNLIQTKVENVITSFANKTSVKLGSVENGISGDSQHKVVDGMPKKSDLITIKGTQYRVLAMNGTQAKVLAMTDVAKVVFNISNTNNTIVYSGGMECQKYENSDLDYYLENIWYEELSQDIKDAIIPQNIEQSMCQFDDDGTPAEAYFWHKYDFTSTDTEPLYDGDYYVLQKMSSVLVGIRHVYALDVEDVIDYLGSSFTPQQVNTMFYNVDYSVGSFEEFDLWLRSANFEFSSSASSISANEGALTFTTYNNSAGARPAFVIDLSKVDFAIN